MMTITINGETHSVEKGSYLLDVLARLEIDKNKVAVERNLEIVPRSTFDTVALSDGDRIEIVHFIGGG